MKIKIEYREDYVKGRDKMYAAMYGPPPFYKRKISCMAILLLLGALIGGIITWFHIPRVQQDCVYGPPPIEEPQPNVYGPPPIEEPEPQPDLYGPPPVEEQEQLPIY